MRYLDVAYTIVQFGKHRGKFYCEVPTDYLKWAIKTLDDYQASNFAIELQRRDKSYRKANGKGK